MQKLGNSTVAALKERFETTEQILQYFSYHKLRERRREKGLLSLKDCVRQPFARLEDIAAAYEPESAVLIVKVYLTNLMDNLNINRMTADQTYEVAELIYEECPRIKISELHEFFRRIKAAYYGEYYGSIDCVKVMSDFRQFLEDRAASVRSILKEVDKEAKRLWEVENEHAACEGKLLLYAPFVEQKRKELLAGL